MEGGSEGDEIREAARAAAIEPFLSSSRCCCCSQNTKNPCVGPGPTLAFVFEMGEPLEDFEETEKGDVTKAMRNKGRSRWWPDRSRWSTVRAELMGVGGGHKEDRDGRSRI